MCPELPVRIFHPTSAMQRLLPLAGMNWPNSERQVTESSSLLERLLDYGSSADPAIGDPTRLGRLCNGHLPFRWNSHLLKQPYQLDNVTDPIAQLDQIGAGWKLRFPILLEHDAVSC